MTNADNWDTEEWHAEVRLKSDNSVLSFHIVITQEDADRALNTGRFRSHVAYMYAGAYLAVLEHTPDQYEMLALYRCRVDHDCPSYGVVGTLGYTVHDTPIFG